MSTKQMLADALLAESGGLYEWAMDQRRAVRPSSWDEVAAALAEATEMRVVTSGRQLRTWLAEIEEAEAEERAGVEVEGVAR